MCSTPDAEHDQLVKLRALIDALDACVMVSRARWGVPVETDPEHYLVPRGAWRTLVATARESAA